MSKMRGRLVTTWLVRISVLVFLVATLFAMNTYAASSRHCHGAAVPICEQIEFDDLDEVRLEPVTLSKIFSPQQPAITHEVITMLQLSSFIFQPPEGA